jgi:hypothetical protein
MSNEDILCTFGQCKDPAFFRIENLRDQVTKCYCTKHYVEFIITGLNKVQQAAFKQSIKDKIPGFEFQF